ncbi:hypothetical protein MHYP_G00243850 [Metynnis hypsauchen]
MNTAFTNATLNIIDEKLIYVASMLLMSMQVVNVSLGLPLNIYSVFLLIRAGGLDAIFTLSQRVSEILFSLFAPQYVLCAVDIDLCFHKSVGFSLGIFMSARLLFQCCTCVVHYMAVVHPVIFLKFRPMRYRLGCLIGICACVLVCSFTAMLTFPYMPFNIFGGLYFTILVVELFCCVSILKALKQSGPGKMQREEGGKKKAFDVIFINLVTMLIQNVPMGIVFSLEPFLFMGSPHYCKKMNTTFTKSTLNVLNDQLTYVASVLLMSIQIINFSLCVPLNVYVIFIFARTGVLDAVFTLSQSVSEIIFAFSIVQYILCVVGDYLYFMKSLGFFVSLFITARPIFQCCVCWERYLTVVHPLTFLKLKPLRYHLAFLIMVWTFVLFCCIYAMLTFPDTTFNFFGSLYLVTLVVKLFCCVSILKVLRQPGPGDRREESGKRDSRKKANVVLPPQSWQANISKVHLNAGEAEVMLYRLLYSCELHT